MLMGVKDRQIQVRSSKNYVSLTPPNRRQVHDRHHSLYHFPLITKRKQVKPTMDSMKLTSPKWYGVKLLRNKGLSAGVFDDEHLTRIISCFSSSVKTFRI